MAADQTTDSTPQEDKGSQGCPDCPDKPSFKKDIAVLFSDRDQDHMSSKLDLHMYDDVKNNAELIYKTLQPHSPWPGGSRMPKGGPYWQDTCIDCFKKWMDTGYTP